VHVAALVSDLLFPRDGPTAFISRCRLQIRDIDHPGHLGTKDIGLARARMLPLNQTSKSRRFSCTRLLARVSGQMGPAVRGCCRLAAPR
jgi:hypothetical protein